MHQISFLKDNKDNLIMDKNNKFQNGKHLHNNKYHLINKHKLEIMLDNKLKKMLK